MISPCSARLSRTLVLNAIGIKAAVVDDVLTVDGALAYMVSVGYKRSASPASSRMGRRFVPSKGLRTLEHSKSLSLATPAHTKAHSRLTTRFLRHPSQPPPKMLTDAKMSDPRHPSRTRIYSALGILFTFTPLIIDVDSDFSKRLITRMRFSAHDVVVNLLHGRGVVFAEYLL